MFYGRPSLFRLKQNALTYSFLFQLNDNNICQVEKSAFEDTSSLHSLSLSNNRLTRLHQSTFDKIQEHIARLEISGKLDSLNEIIVKIGKHN